MKNLRGFTLIELLIVVAIIAILAAIAVPNFLEAQTRAKVSRAMADMRSIGTAIESYAVDYSMNPACARNNANTLARVEDLNGPDNKNQAWSMNAGCYKVDDDGDFKELTPGFWRTTFATISHGQANNKHDIVSITTPVAYIAALPFDPFTKANSVNYGYANVANQGWIMWSAGPDMDLNLNAAKDGITGSPLDLAFAYTTVTVATDGTTLITAVGAPSWNVLTLGMRKDVADNPSWAEITFASAGNHHRVMEDPWVKAKAYEAGPPTKGWEGLKIPYDKGGENPTTGLLRMSYDATNGSLSSGDLWRLSD